MASLLYLPLNTWASEGDRHTPGAGGCIPNHKVPFIQGVFPMELVLHHRHLRHLGGARDGPDPQEADACKATYYKSQAIFYSRGDFSNHSLTRPDYELPK
ncbi:hypothetical protein HHUSO_G7550 [Huso huso]|uniref:Uncharacterized protein n=1 Tax=Huso huso TaxID=61971 RepID=A0ABR0ZV21_HUSHU